MRILFVSHTAAGGTFRVGSHHLAAAMARAGHEVVHASTPVSRVLTAVRRGSAERRQLAAATPRRDPDGVLHVIPAVGLPAQLGGHRAFARAVQRASSIEVFDVVLLDEPMLAHPAIRDLGRRFVYRPTDLYPSGFRARGQRRALVAAEAVVATSPVVLAALSPAPAARLVLPNGVDFARFAVDHTGERHGAVYVGALDDRFDWTAVLTMARAHPAERFTIAGPVADGHPGLPGNVRLLGAVRYEDVPALLAQHRVGLLPFSDSKLNSGRSPMKRYEYLASGLSIVGRGPGGDEAAGVFDYQQIGDATGALFRALSAAAPNTTGRELAHAEDWSRKADDLIRFVDRIE